jgi:chloramphenicol 3-O-phosphotransferase
VNRITVSSPDAGKRGLAIFINGIPSSGKSTVAAKIKRRTTTFRMLTGDEVIRQVPFAQRVALADRLFALTLDTIERRLESTTLVVDGAWTEQQVREARDRFGDMGLYVILRIDEAERRRRESIRKDRRLAYWDPAWHDKPGSDDPYDIVIDSEANKPDECAKFILNKAREHWQLALL